MPDDRCYAMPWFDTSGHLCQSRLAMLHALTGLIVLLAYELDSMARCASSMRECIPSAEAMALS